MSSYYHSSLYLFISNYLLCTCFIILLNCSHLATKKTCFHPASLQKQDQSIPKNNTAVVHRPHLASAESSNLGGAIDLSRGCLMFEKEQEFDDVFRTKWLRTTLETKIMPSIILGVSYIWFLLGMVNLIMSCLSIQPPGTNGKSFPGRHQFSGFFPVGDWNPSAEEILLSQSYSR